MLHQIASFCIFGIFQLIRADTTQLTAIISKGAVLPCRFRPAPLSEIVLHWMYIKKEGSIVVHSFYRSMDQFSNQDDHYRGRTKLFHSEISVGNASLLLTKINMDDEGVYQCYISTSKGKKEENMVLQVAGDFAIANLQFYPPNMLDNVTNIICAITGAYPKPLLTFSENGTDLTNDTRLSTTEGIDQKHLHNIKSILKIDHMSQDTYKCNIINERLKKSLTASWKMQGTLKENETHSVTITCNYSSINDQNFEVVWRFRSSSDSPSVEVCPSVPQYVNNSGCDNNQLKIQTNHNSSSLTLHHVMKEAAGEYTCEVKTEDTWKIFTYILQIDLTPHEESQKHRHLGLLFLPVYVAILPIFFFVCVHIRTR